MNELTRAEQFVYTQLGNLGTGITVYSGIAPLQATYPYVVVQVQSPGADVMTANAFRIWSTPLFLVKAINKAQSWQALATIADLIDTRLHNVSGTTSDGRILSCVRESPFSLIEDDNGVQLRHLGGLFRIQIQALGT